MDGERSAIGAEATRRRVADEVASSAILGCPKEVNGTIQRFMGKRWPGESRG